VASLNTSNVFCNTNNVCPVISHDNYEVDDRVLLCLHKATLSILISTRTTYQTCYMYICNFNRMPTNALLCVDVPSMLKVSSMLMILCSVAPFN